MGLNLTRPLQFLERSLTNWLSGNPVPDWRTELFFPDDHEDESMPSHITEITEFGLLLPNGQVLWNSYSSHSLATPADRQVMVQILRKTAEECGFAQDAFISNYSWVSRKVRTEVTDLGTFALGDSTIIGLDIPSDVEDYGDYDNSNDIAEASGAVGSDGHGGDLCKGSVGGVAPGSA